MAKFMALLWLVLGTAFAGGLMLVALALPAAAGAAFGALPYAAFAGFGLAAPIAFWIARSIEPSEVPGQVPGRYRKI